MKIILSAAFCTLLACNEKTETAGVAAAKPLNLAELPKPQSGTLRGTIVLNPAFKDKVKSGDVIFLMARNVATGGIIAVSKLNVPEQFPLSFQLDGDDVMLPGASLVGQVKLSARLDKDGDAISKNPGDIAGEIKDPVQVSSENVVISLDKML